MAEIALTRFTGFAETYDCFRPVPPNSIALLILDIFNRKKVDTVVDLGCGTGLSTYIWKEKANRIIGIEPNVEMLKKANEKNSEKNVSFQQGTSYQTGLEDNSVDIVACGQSFHWMEPESTLNEINRILKPRSIFVAFDNDWPPVVSPECDRAYKELFSVVLKLTKKHSDILPKEQQYPKEKHLENIKISGHFSYSKEIVLHNTEECSCERFINLAISQGSLQSLLKSKIEGIDDNIEIFRKRVITDFKSDEAKRMWTNYKIRLGMKE